MKKQEGIFGSIRMNKQKYIDEFLRLYRKGLNYSQIAKELGVSSSAIQDYASKNGFTSNYRKYEDIEFTNEELQVFLGTMYGDGCLTKYSKNSNARLHFAHSLK